MQKATTLGELKKQGYVSRSIKDEIRQNLIKKITANIPSDLAVLYFFCSYYITKRNYGQKYKFYRTADIYTIIKSY